MKKKAIIIAAIAVLVLAGGIIGLILAKNAGEAAREEKFVGTWTHSKEEVVIREKGKCIVPYTETCSWKIDEDDENVLTLTVGGNGKEMTVTGTYEESGNYKKLLMYGANGKETYYKR